MGFFHKKLSEEEREREIRKRIYTAPSPRGDALSQLRAYAQSQRPTPPLPPSPTSTRYRFGRAGQIIGGTTQKGIGLGKKVIGLFPSYWSEPKKKPRKKYWSEPKKKPRKKKRKRTRPST